MRSKSLSGVIWGVVAVLTLLSSSHGQAITNIFAYDQSWKYEMGGTNMPAAWKTTNYDDSAWLSGPAVFGWPTSEPLPADAVNMGATIWTGLFTNSPTGNYIQTFYFRTTFEFTNALTNVVLVASNVIDDGAVFYLNGAELGRIGMPNGAIAHTTSANRGGNVTDAGRGVDVLSWGATNLVQGTNVLAVEVHQSGGTSSDVIFGMNLSFYKGTRAAITQQPATNLVIDCAGKPASFSVTATGSDISYMWYSNNVYMSNQVGSIMRLDAVNTVANNATFYVIVSNALNTVRSSNAVLRVFPDQCGPRVLLAESRDNVGFTNEIEVSFNERIRLTNASHYSVAALSNAQPGIAVTSALFVTNLPVSLSNTMVRLSLNQPLYRSNAYNLTINNVRDELNNIIAPHTRIPITFKTVTNIIPFGSTWRFTDIWTITPSFENTWTNLNFLDSDWGEGSATFVRDNFRSTACYPDGTSLGYGAPTIYFRKRFGFIANLGPRVELILTNQVDDGAVFYLNGNEIMRRRMPAGPIGHSTRPNPNTTAEYTCSVTNIDVASSVVNRGNNILAVEVHNTSGDPIGDDDALFETSLSFGIQSGSTLQRPPRPSAAVTRSGSNIRIGWPTNGLGTNTGFILEFANHVNTNFWREVQTNMANPFITPMTNAARFYRLRLE